MGSAVSALAWRLPRHRSWVRDRSACPGCGATLGPADLVPLLSFVLSRGKCRHCGRPIGWRYPLTELICGAPGALVFSASAQSPGASAHRLVGVHVGGADVDRPRLPAPPDASRCPGRWWRWPSCPHAGGARHAPLGIKVGSGLLRLLAWGYPVRSRGMGATSSWRLFGAPLGWRLSLVTLPPRSPDPSGEGFWWRGAPAAVRPPRRWHPAPPRRQLTYLGQ
jgi:hypothetical protein